MNCSDFRVLEPAPFNPGWYSHRLYGPGLRYETGTSLAHGTVVWAFGQFQRRAFEDLRIFYLKLESVLCDKERAVVARGYPYRNEFPPDSEGSEAKPLIN